MTEPSMRYFRIFYDDPSNLNFYGSWILIKSTSVEDAIDRFKTIPPVRYRAVAAGELKCPDEIAKAPLGFGDCQLVWHLSGFEDFPNRFKAN